MLDRFGNAWIWLVAEMPDSGARLEAELALVLTQNTQWLEEIRRSADSYAAGVATSTVGPTVAAPKMPASGGIASFFRA